MGAVPAGVVGRRLEVPRVIPVVIMTTRISAIRFLQSGMIHIRTAVGLPNHDPLSAHIEFLPDPIGTDRPHIPLKARRGRLLACHGEQRTASVYWAQARAGNDPVHFRTGREVQANESAALYFDC